MAENFRSRYDCKRMMPVDHPMEGETEIPPSVERTGNEEKSQGIQQFLEAVGLGSLFTAFSSITGSLTRQGRSNCRIRDQVREMR